MRILLAGVQALASVFLCLVAGVAHADIKTVTWTNPTTNTNGTALAASQITRTTVYWGATTSTMTSAKVVLGAGTSTTIDLAPGTYFIGAKTTANGNDSPMSNIVQAVIPQPTPNPPVIAVQEVVAGINMSPAYRVTATGQRGSTVVGFVPVGTACTGPVVYTYRTKAYRKVPRSSVKWWGTSPTDEVAAACA